MFHEDIFYFILFILGREFQVGPYLGGGKISKKVRQADNIMKT